MVRSREGADLVTSAAGLARRLLADPALELSPEQRRRAEQIVAELGNG